MTGTMDHHHYWVVRSLVGKLQDLHVRVGNHTRNLRDHRHLHAFQELQRQVEHTLRQCQEKMSGMSEPDALHCDSHKCHELLPHRSALLYPPYCYDELKSAMEEEAGKVFDAWLLDQASRSYYTWKKFGKGPIHPPIGDLSSWRVVCVGEDGVVLRTHPLLHHPADFLIQEPTIQGTRYADKARFSCYFPDSLSAHKVVLTKEPSVLPKLIRG